jgi:HEAT repeat protein
MSMEIHFCDLCNESVPQSDLDLGRAFLRKGRVVCAKCDAIMTAGQVSEPRAEFGRPEPFQGLAPNLAAGPFAGSPGTAVASAPSTAFAAAGSGSAELSSLAGARGSGASKAGIALALLGMLLTGAVAYVLNDRHERQLGELNQRQDQVVASQRSANLQSESRARLAEDASTKLTQLVESRFSDLRQSLDQALAQDQESANAAKARLAQLSAEIRDLRDALVVMQHHEDERASAQARLERIAEEFDVLRGQVDDVKRLATAPAPVAAPHPSEPAWMGLVKQLSSDKLSDRWTAVQSLGETGDPAVVEHLLPMLKDPDVYLRMATARQLEKLGSPKAIGPLIEALEDQEAPVREAAYIALLMLSKRNLPFDPYQEPGERAKRVKAWQEWWKKAQSEFTGA